MATEVEVGLVERVAKLELQVKYLTYAVVAVVVIHIPQLLMYMEKLWP